MTWLLGTRLHKSRLAKRNSCCQKSCLVVGLFVQTPESWCDLFCICHPQNYSIKGVVSFNELPKHELTNSISCPAMCVPDLKNGFVETCKQKCRLQVAPPRLANFHSLQTPPLNAGRGADLGALPLHQRGGEVPQGGGDGAAVEQRRGDRRPAVVARLHLDAAPVG